MQVDKNLHGIIHGWKWIMFHNLLVFFVRPASLNHTIERKQFDPKVN
jgi:hypothetical protein